MRCSWCVRCNRLTDLLIYTDHFYRFVLPNITFSEWLIPRQTSARNGSIFGPIQPLVFLAMVDLDPGTWEFYLGGGTLLARRHLPPLPGDRLTFSCVNLSRFYSSTYVT